MRLMSRGVFSSFALLLVTAFGNLTLAQRTPHDRLAEQITGSGAVRLAGSVHPAARAEFDRGPAEPSLKLERITLVFKPTAAQQQELETLVREQQDPASPNYHRWLTPEEFGTRFGLSDNDLNKVASWLQARGFTIVETPRSRRSITFSGTAGQVSAAFHTDIHRFVVNGESHFANATDPLLPAPLAEITLGIRSLHNFAPKPRGMRARQLGAQFTSSISGSHFLAPADFATIYNLNPLYKQGIDGTGQKIAVMGQTNIDVNDIRTFRSVSNLPANDPQVILVPGAKDPGIVKDDIGEADLDIEWAGAVARNATIVYVYDNPTSGGGAFGAMQYAINHPDLTAPVISISYGACEWNGNGAPSVSISKSDATTLDALFQQANLQGQTIVGPSGDSGAADCDYSNGTTKVASATHGLAVDFPASSPSVTAIGGSTFNEGTATLWSAVNDASNGSALSYIPETVWNDTAIDGDLSAGGGGLSTFFPKQPWQAAALPTQNMRGVPDITLAASADHDGFLACSQASCVNGFRQANDNLTVYGGTSAGVPSFAGIVALLNQKYGAQGNVNSRLYELASSTPAAFNDITSGDNKVPCVGGTKDCNAPSGSNGSLGYSAAPGYDLATGLGSVNACQLVTTWKGGPAQCDADFKLGINPDNATTNNFATLVTARGSSATATVAVSALNGFSGTVDLTCSLSSNLTGVTCSFDKTSIAAGSTAKLTLKAASVSAGVHNAPMPGSNGWANTGLVFFAAIVLVGGARSRRLRDSLSRNAGTWAGILMLCAMAAIMLACGGGGGSGSNASTSTPVTSSCLSLTAVQGTAITPTTMPASGGSGSYTFSAAGLPSGLTMSSGGTISGTPTVGGTFNYTVTITDSTGRTATVGCTMTVSQTGTLTVNATSGGVNKTVQMNVTVN